MTYEVRYEDSRGRYTEEQFDSLQEAQRRATAIEEAGIDADVYEVTK